MRSGDFNGNATAVRKRKMRRIGGSFWTPDRDEKLRRLEGEGLSAGKIAEKLGTTRGSVIGRLHRLSGVALTFPSYIRQEQKARARAVAREKERKRIESTVISKMQQEIARGSRDYEGAEGRRNAQVDWGRSRDIEGVGAADC